MSTLRVLTLAFACFGLAVVSLMQYIAHGSRLALITWPLALAMVGAHVVVQSPTALATAALIAAMLLLLAASTPALARVQPLLRPQMVEQPHGAARAGGPGITVVIPSYNPGPVVVRTVREVLDQFANACIPVHVIVVSDGSTDVSPDLLDGIDRTDVTHVRRSVNQGKGAALRAGFAQCATPLIGFIDADGDIAPGQLLQMVRIHEESGADIVYGSKTHLDSEVSVSPLRRLYSRVYRFLIRHMFQLDIADTQTGIKLYTAPLMRTVLPVLQERRFALDLEMFVASRANGFAHFIEVPVTLRRRGGSTVSFRTVLSMLRDTTKIFWRAKVTLRYLRAASERRTRSSEDSLVTAT